MACSAIWDSKMRAVFRSLDKKEALKVGHEEMVAFALGFQKHGRISEEGEKELRKNVVGFWKELKADGGEVNADDFVSIHQRLVTDKVFGETTWENYMKNIAVFAFHSVADPGTHTMGESEYREFLICLGVKELTKAPEIFKEISDGKKALTMEEFVTIWKDFTLNTEETKSQLLFGTL